MRSSIHARMSTEQSADSHADQIARVRLARMRI